MGTLVANMGPDGLGDTKKLHPFFAPGRTDQMNQQVTTVTDTGNVLQEADNAATNSNEVDEGGERKKKRRKPNSNVHEASETADSKKRRAPPRKKANDSLGPSIIDSLKTVGGTADSCSATEAPPTSLGAGQAQLPDIENGPASADNPSVPPAGSKPKKLLEFNPKTGTIGSPPKPKPKADAPRKTKASAKSKQGSYVVSIKYGKDVESRECIGQKINEILSVNPTATATATKPKKRGRPSKADPARKDANAQDANASRSTSQTRPAKPPRQTIFSSTPCSPKKSRPTFRNTGNLPQFGMKSTGLRIPGAAHPSWPAKGMVHITGEPERPRAALDGDSTPAAGSKKRKGRPTFVSSQETVIQQLCDQLDIDDVRDVEEESHDGFSSPPIELRLPAKHFESGPKLQKRIQSELRTPLPLTDSTDDSDDDVVGAVRRTPHAAVTKLFQSLSTNLSAFDKSECEDHIWAHKYAPETASQVLQPGREAVMLRDWLETLKVQSVDTGSAPDQKAVAVKPAPKKRRKRAKLDDFIVSSDEDVVDPDELTDPEDAEAGATKQTVVQNGGVIPNGSKDNIGLSNVALLSGPHGSGKTATVYAVARELGFEIFEINSSSRRSGKDVMERVGDMTRNHLVQHHQDDEKREDDKVAKNLQTGKQGTMMSFFKPKAAKPMPKPESKSESEPQAPAKEDAKQPKSQKQSLILLEEADVLFEEDKQFWATVTAMIMQSKRPFIMTCNDESTIPFQSLNFYGIFRFSPPPKDLAVDVLLLVAANEGHALRRPAVEALVESRSGDLRAALTELNYWCQISVGDRRGGFDWFYPRWPRGRDKDEKGDVVRVVSEATYLEGMGWLDRDAAMQPTLASEEELTAQAWESFSVDLDNWHETCDMTAWADKLTRESSDSRSKLASLDLFDKFAESMSAADLCSNGRYGVGLKENLDATQPDIPSKARDDYILGRKLLEAPIQVEYEPLSVAASVSIRSKAREIAQTATQAPTMARVTERSAMAKIRDSFTAGLDATMTRMDLALAFDPIAASERQSLSAASHLDPSVFDRTTGLITLEVAPYVRGIVAYERQLAEGRIQRGNLVSEGARPTKRLRQTRAAMSAGGEGMALRKESHFRARLNQHLVMRTGGKWEDAVAEEVASYPDIILPVMPAPVPGFVPHQDLPPTYMPGPPVAGPFDYSFNTFNAQQGFYPVPRMYPPR